ncbi:MAG TPA: glycoside hydrolase family 3 N-terminal domain-containing protein [Dermatophilaceae bacterium]|nr:glycoside hydrolase family 3 N-terminal domain-containing protein [Dermatophilaceae bacterium]
MATSPIGGLPTAAELSTARADVARLSTRDLAGQLVVARYAGTAPAAAAALVGRLHLGGVAVFAGNVPTATAAVVPTLREVARAATAALAGQGRRWPAFLAVDQEGGPVTRVGAPATAFPAAMALGAAGGDVLARQVGAASGAELAAMGFTVVLAPDADVTIGPSDPTIGVRSPGGDPRLVARVAVGLARGYAEAGLVPVAKHFPGHGSVTTDSHLGLPRQARSVTVLERRDLVPFRALVDQGAPAVMTAHIVVTGLDDARPASLSRGVTTGLLRERLGFTGLVVTDALEMDAVTAGYGAGRAAVLAVQAGADVLLMPADPGAAVDALVTAVDRRQLTRTRLVDSAARMVATLRHAARRTRSRPSPGTVGSHRGTARALADAAVTVVSGPCRGRLVGSAISVTGALSADRGGLAAAALRAGLHVGGGTQVRLLGGGVYNAGSRSASGSETGSGDVVVALDVPYGLARSSARTARLAAYGRTSATFDAVVAVLLGRQPARGHLPVPVGDHKIGTGC